VRASIGDLRLTFKLFWLVPSRTFAFGTYRRAFVAPRQPFMAATTCGATSNPPSA